MRIADVPYEKTGFVYYWAPVCSLWNAASVITTGCAWACSVIAIWKPAVKLRPDRRRSSNGSIRPGVPDSGPYHLKVYGAIGRVSVYPIFSMVAGVCDDRDQMVPAVNKGASESPVSNGLFWLFLCAQSGLLPSGCCFIAVDITQN